MKKTVFAIALCAASLSGCASDPGDPTIVNETAVEHGAFLFSDPSASAAPGNAFACATCHLATDDAAATRIYPGAVMAGVVSRPSYWGGEELDLLRSINACRFYFMSDSKAWEPGDELADAMYAYLTSLPAEHVDAVPFSVVQAVADLPAGDKAAGKTVYDRACATCHGGMNTGTGRLTTVAPIIPKETLAEHAADGFTDDQQRVVFIEKIRHGGFLGYGGTMPPFSLEAMSDAELADLLAYLELY